MHYFTIKDIENLSGIKAHTWRIWEQRYNLCLPQRKDSNHRFYNNDNLKQILRISYLYHTGLKISKIAKFNEQQLIDASIQEVSPPPGYEFYIKELMEASIDFDDVRFEKNCNEIFDTYGPENAVTEAIYPYLEKIGMLWLTDHIIPTQEHFSSNLIRQKIIRCIDELPAVKENGSNCTVLFTPEKEHHELPLLFIHYLMKKAGKPVLYFGSDISIAKLKSLAAEKPFSQMHFHLITNLTNKDAQQYVSQLATAFSDKQICMSGTQVAHVHNKPANFKLLHTLSEMISFIKEPVAVAH
jgi:MerR family transcriptional regulator, light-induced transcriptional regulator